MNAVSRIDVPVGTVPPLHDFIRHVWRYRDEDGQTSLCPPPDVFTLVLDDKDEADNAVTLATFMVHNMGFDGRVTSQFNGPHVLIAFKDLHALHAFLKIISLHVDSLPSREVAAFCMATLGFRWT